MLEFKEELNDYKNYDMCGDVLHDIHFFLLPMLSMSDKFRIRHTTIYICMREHMYLYSKLSVFEFE
jgi:hypothetical protein